MISYYFKNYIKLKWTFDLKVFYIEQFPLAQLSKIKLSLRYCKNVMLDCQSKAVILNWGSVR